MSSTAPQRPNISPGEFRWAAVSFVEDLDPGELLSGTPGVAEVGTSDLTISNEAVNSAELVINDVAVAIGKAVQFYVSGAVIGITYKITVTVTTDSSPAQTIIGTLYLPTTGV